MRKILFLVSSGFYKDKHRKIRGVNGPEIRFREFLKLSKSKDKFILIYGNGLLSKEFREIEKIKDNVRFHNAQNSDFLSIIICFIKFIWCNKIDVVHTQGPISYDFINLIFSLFFRYKSIVTRPVLRRDEKFKTLNSRILFSIDQLLLPKASQVIAISNYHYKNLLKNISKKKLSLIFNGVDLNKFINSKKTLIQEFNEYNPFLITFVAQFTDVKRQDILIDSLLYLDDLYLEINFLGSGPNLNKIKNLIRKNKNRKHKITLHGHLDDTSILLKKSHLNCLLSDREGLPVSMLEAQASGCALLGSNVGAMDEIIESGENGFLVNMQFAEQEVAQYIRIMYEDSKILQNMMDQSRIKSTKFDIQNMINSYENVYHNI